MASQKVAEDMNAYWAQFAKSGDPNGASVPAQRPQFTATEDKRLQLDSDWRVLEDFRAKECDFWRKYYGVL